MRKIIILITVLLLSLVVFSAGCTNPASEKSGTMYIGDYVISYKVNADGIFTFTFVKGYSQANLVGPITVWNDSVGNITASATWVDFGTTTSDWDASYLPDHGWDTLRFLAWPEKFATSSYLNTYYYGNVTVVKVGNHYDFTVGGAPTTITIGEYPFFNFTATVSVSNRLISYKSG